MPDQSRAGDSRKDSTSTWETEAGELKAKLVHTGSSRPARATEQDSVSKAGIRPAQRSTGEGTAS